MILDYAEVEKGFLGAGMPPELVSELMEAFAEAKRRYYRSDFRPNAVEGGRFTEAVFRILEWATSGGSYTALGKTLPKVDKLMVAMENATTVPDSIRLHVPRTLRLIYDIRNKRDAAHLGDGIDPNLQDATLVVRSMEWVMAELARLYHSVAPSEAQAIIESLVSKEVPSIQVFEGFPRVLKNLKASDHVLVLLYWRGASGAAYEEIASWVRASMRGHLRRTLKGLDAKDLVHQASGRWVLTRKGEVTVETAKMVEPE